MTIYTIGYDLGDNNCTRGGFRKKKTGGGYTTCATVTTGCYHYLDASTESPVTTSNQALLAIASPNNFYAKPSPGDLSTIFAAIATDIGSGSSRLVDDDF